MTDGKDKAFPGEWQKNSLTKREYFAAMAMQGIVSNGEMMNTTEWNWLAEHSVKVADALINALNKYHNA